MRVALLTNILTPYRLPVYADLAATPGWQLRLLVGAASDPSWERAFAGAHEAGAEALDVEVVPSIGWRRRVRSHARHPSEQLATLQWPLGAFSALRRFRPDVVVSAELGPRSAIAAAWAAWAGVPLVLWSYHARTAAAATSGLRRGFRRRLLARADAVVGMGRQAREVLGELGVPADKLYDAPNAHAAGFWERQLAACDPVGECAALRTRSGARERVALVAGRLEASKGIEPLLAAWRALPESLRAEWTLLFVGDGPLLAAVESARAAAAPGEIAHLPAQPPEALAGLYVAADRLVFASLGDPWGLVVNEAMAAGLPVLCSRWAGCADDLVRPGETGWLFDPTDPATASAALAAALRDPEAARLGARARDAIKRFGPPTQAQGLRRAILAAARD